MLKIYFAVCAFMLLVTYVKIWGDAIAFKKAHPNAKFIKQNLAQAFVNIVRLILYFACPILNLFIFIGVVFVISDDRVNEIIASKCEVL